MRLCQHRCAVVGVSLGTFAAGQLRSRMRNEQPRCHYLQKWHIEYNPDANKLAKEEGFDEWWEALHSHSWWTPTLDMDKRLPHCTKRSSSA